MMDAQEVNGVAPKASGSHRRAPSYSVETPYGFHLDLDFVKYVEDIEKGHTLRRVQLQRRPRVRSSGNLVRNLSLPGYSCGVSQQHSSVSFPRSRLADSWRPCDLRRSGGDSPSESSLTFDGHERPNLLRASSLPLTAIQRKRSGDDLSSPDGAGDILSQQNGSSEDVFLGHGGASATLQQLTAALLRVGELEEEIRVVPELKAQICILQEERERRLHAAQPEPSIGRTLEKRTNPSQDWMDQEYEQLEENVKTFSQHVEAESLQRKIATLEQKLHRLESDLEKTTHLLQELERESRFKDERICELTKQKEEGIWVGPGNMMEPPDTENKSKPSGQMCLSESEFQLCATRRAPGSQVDMERHVKRVRELLQEQWECLRGDDNLPPRVCSIQTQLVSLVQLLTLYASAAGHQPTSALGSENEDQSSVVKTWESPEQEHGRDRSAEPEFDPNARAQELRGTSAEPTGQKEHHEGQDRMREAQDPDDQTGKEEQQRSGEESEAASRSEGVRELETDFMKACHFLEEHMDEVSEPDDDMRRALTVVFQRWFHACAEENSCADTVALYVSSVAAETPSVLQFLVNMVDANGNAALHYSVSHGNFGVAGLLLRTGVCDVDLKNQSGYTPIMLACLQPLDADTDVDVVRRLMELGDVNARVGLVGQTALHLAVRHGRASAVRLLLAHGADVNAQDEAGTTALISACDRGHTDIVRILLRDPECDVALTDKGSRSALSLATQASHTEIAELLRSRSSGAKAQDKCKMA